MEARDGKIGDAGQDVGEPCFRVNLVEATGRDERQHDGGTISAALGTGKCPIAAAEGNPAQRSLGGVVRETNSSVFQETGKTIPALQHVVHGFDDIGGSAEGGALPFQPRVHVVEQRLALLLPYSQSFFGAQSVDLALDLEQRVEPLDRLQRDRGDRPAIAFAVPGAFLDIGQLKEFPPRMGMAKGECDRYLFLFGNRYRLEPVVTIRLQNAAIYGQVFLRMLATTLA